MKVVHGHIIYMFTEAEGKIAHHSSLPLQLIDRSVEALVRAAFELRVYVDLTPYTVLVNSALATGIQAGIMLSKGSGPTTPFFFLLIVTLAWVAAPCTAAEPVDCAKSIRVASNGKDGPACLQGNGSCKTLHYAFTNCTITNSTQFLIGPGTFSLTQDLGSIYTTAFSWLEGLVVKGSGAKETTIDCSNASGLAFVNMTNLTISDLTLFNCSQSRPSTSIGNVSELYTVPFQVGLYIWRCTDVVIENVHINETIGVGLVLYETGGRVSINSSVFHHNGIPENMADTLYGGGGVNVEFPYCPPGYYDDDDECGKEFSGAEYTFNNCNFTNNTARLTLRYSTQFITQEHSIHQSFGRGGGMAIYFSGNSSNNNVSLSNCHFVGNTAVVGGGLLGEFNDGTQNNSLNLLYCYFIENTCFNSTQVNGGGGGGVRLGFLLYKANSVANNEIHIEYTLFEQNTAYLGGGLSFVTGYEQGVLAPTNQLAMMSSIFRHNIARLGSAVNLMPWNSPSTGLVAKVEMQNCIFANNSVLYSKNSWYLMGFGTMYSYKVPFDIKGGITYFYTNTGSGIVVVGTGVNVRSGSVVFLGNVATNGGAIAAYANGWVTLWNGTVLDFVANTAQGRGGAIYSESTGGHQIVESRDCVIRYFEWWKRYEEWNTHVYFQENFAHETGVDIFVSSLFPCLRSGSNGSADISVEARKKVFRAAPVFHYLSNITNTSIVTSTASIKFKVKAPRDDLHIVMYPGEVFNFTTQIRPLDELDAFSNVPFFATTNVSNNSFPAALVDLNSVYTTGYLQFQASKNAALGHGNVKTTVQLQTVTEPALQFSFNVTLSDCLPGSYLNFPTNAPSGQCACSRNSKSAGYLTGIICYEHGSNLSVYRQASIWYGKVPSKTHTMKISVTAPCPQYCDHSNSVYNLVPLNQTDPTSGICRGHSHGILCGTCDYGVLITSHTSECCTLEEKQAISVPVAWVSWIAIQIFLTTVVVLVIFLFGFNVIGGTLCSFVFFSQVVLDLNLQDCTSGTSHVVIENIERFYAFWSLRFRWLLPRPMKFCIPSFSNTLEALSLDYAFALYPFLLIVFVWVIGKCQERGCCQNVQRWLALRNSLVHGIATCLILTYGDLVSVSFFLLTPAYLNVPYNTSDPSDIQGGPWRSLYNGNYAYFGFPHYLFGIWAIIIVVLFGFLPPLFLMSYPALPQLLRKCSVTIGDKVEGWYRVRVVHHFLDLFQGHFKDNRRYFAGVWLLYRLILHANDAFAPNCTVGFAIQISFGIIFLLLHSILQPNRKTKYNILDSFFLANIALLSTLGLVSWASNGQGSDNNVMTAAMAIFLLPPLLYFFCVVIYRIANCIYVRCFGRGQDPGDQQPLLDVASAALMRRLGGRQKSSSIRQASSGDDEEGRRGDGADLRDSVTFSATYGSVSIQGVSEAEVSVVRPFATNKAQDEVN